MPPTLSSFDWTIICIAASFLSGLAVFFLKDVFKRNDRQTDDIQDIQKKSVSRDDLKQTVAELKNDSKSTATKLDEHEKAINHIKLTYVTKDEVRELKAELRGEIKKLTTDIEEIKANYLTEQSFIRNHAKVEQKVERMYDILLASHRKE